MLLEVAQIGGDDVIHPTNIPSSKIINQVSLPYRAKFCLENNMKWCIRIFALFKILTKMKEPQSTIFGEKIWESAFSLAGQTWCFYRGELELEMHRYDNALDDFNKAIDVDPMDALAYNNRAELREILGEYKLAIEDLNIAIKLDSNYASAYLNRGFLQKIFGKDTLALADYDRAIDIDDSQGVFYIDRGILKLEMGDVIGACDDWISAQEMQFDVSAFQFLLDKYCKD